jgi:hypothetical protein
MHIAGFSPYYGRSFAMGGLWNSDLIMLTALTITPIMAAIAYKPRTSSRTATSNRVSQRNTENVRVSSANSRIRVPNRTTQLVLQMVELAGIIQKRRTNITAGQEQIPATQRISTSSSRRNSYSRSQDHPAATLR